MSIVTRSSRSFVFSVLAMGAVLRCASGQCATQWLPGSGVPGTDEPVLASCEWDPDGAGPATPRLVLGGGFDIAGDALANGLAVWNPATGQWSTLTAGSAAIDGTIRALAKSPTGELFVAGRFAVTGSPGVLVGERVARWDGTSWSLLGAAFDTTLNALAVTSSGDVIAGGAFASAGGTPANRIARWNGVAWSALGAGINGPVNGVVAATNGDVVVVGDFSTAGGVAAENIARWNGATWSPFGSGLVGTPNNGYAKALIELQNGDLVAGGRFAVAGGGLAINVARWNGSSWSAMGDGSATVVNALVQRANGDVIAGVDFEPAVIRWNGVSWSPVASHAGFGFSVTNLTNGDVVVGGQFAINGTSGWNVSRFDGSAWVELHRSFTGNLVSLAVTPDGDLVAGGEFLSTPGGAARRVARFDGTTWAAMGGGMNALVWIMLPLANGDVVAGGVFTEADGLPANHVARWNGTSWSPLASGLNGDMNAAVEMPNGDLIVGGQFSVAGGVACNRLARWNGSSWSALGSGANGTVWSLRTTASGDLIASGAFTSIGGVAANRIARWDGSTWAPLGAGTNDTILAALPLANGDIAVVGAFSSAGGVAADGGARWDGTSWAPLGTGRGVALVQVPNGDLIVAGGMFSWPSSGSDPQIGRWNGSSWSSVGVDLGNPMFCLANLPNGDVVAGGSFPFDGDLRTSPFFARLTTTCPASVTTVGVGCAEANGLDVLTANTLPWVDSTFRATGTGLPTVAIVLTLTSFTSIAQGAVPLSLAFPQAGLGCDALTAPDILGVLITTNGTVESQFSLPSTPPLVGLPFHHQLVSIEVDPLGAWTSVTATNALQLTAGAF